MAVNQIDIEVGKRINDLIDSRKDLSSRQFALSIGMDPSQFAKIVKGVAAISLEKLVEISSKYEVSVEWLVTGVTVEERFQLAEHDPGYKKRPSPGEMTVDLLTLKNQIGSALSSLQEAMQMLGGPLGPETSAAGDPAFQQPGKKKKI